MPVGVNLHFGVGCLKKVAPSTVKFKECLLKHEGSQAETPVSFIGLEVLSFLLVLEFCHISIQKVPRLLPNKNGRYPIFNHV